MIVYTEQEVQQFLAGLNEKDDWWTIYDAINRRFLDEGKRDGHAFKRAILGWAYFEQRKELKLAFKLLFKLSIKSIPLYMTVHPEDIKDFGFDGTRHKYLEFLEYIVRFRLKLGK